MGPRPHGAGNQIGCPLSMGPRPHGTGNQIGYPLSMGPRPHGAGNMLGTLETCWEARVGLV